MPTSSPQLFLLSPAYCGGRRAGYLLRDGSTMALAARLADGTLTLGEAFAFMSGLYFRGKLTYAEKFGRHDPPALVITPTRGLLPPSTRVSAALLHEFAAVDVNAEDARYCAPLERSAAALAASLAPDARIVLLGSIATGKYVSVLARMLAARLHFPIEFVGRGDMSRGGLMLRSVDAGRELEYVVFEPEVRRRGSRPPKLPPLVAAVRTDGPGPEQRTGYRGTEAPRTSFRRSVRKAIL